MSQISSEGINALQLRVLHNVRGRNGALRMIGAETRTEMELVESGDIFQSIVTTTWPTGQFYRFTLSPSGRRRLDAAEASGWRATDPLPKAEVAT